MNWKDVKLHGSGAISRVCGEYQVTDIRLPAANYKIKVHERSDHFVAFPNIALKLSDGTVDGTCGLGDTELEALQKAIANVGAQLASRDVWQDDELEWSDPRDF